MAAGRNTLRNCPDGVLVLTAGVDTQDDRMEYEIVGFGHFGETWGIEKGIISGRPDSDEVWQQLDELVFDRKLKFVDGLELPVSIKFVDEGGHFTQEVRQRCHDRIGKKVFCIKGFPGSDRPVHRPAKAGENHGAEPLHRDVLAVPVGR